MLRVTTIYAVVGGGDGDVLRPLPDDGARARSPACGAAGRPTGSVWPVRWRADDLEVLLSGRDPVSGARLGSALVDRCKRNGKVMRAVSGYDATFSAPKSLSVWWALTGDDRLLEAHDAAVARRSGTWSGSGRRPVVRRDGRMLHPDTGGLTMATFRQTTSRLDDPQLHTHAVISTKVQTADGRWYALDGHYVKRHQRMLGGLYQSVLRAELTAPVRGRLAAGRERAGGDRWRPGRAAGRVLEAVAARSTERWRSRWPSSASGKAADPSGTSARRSSVKRPRTRGAASPGNGVADLTTRWQTEAADVGWTAELLDERRSTTPAATPRRRWTA